MRRDDTFYNPASTKRTVPLDVVPHTNHSPPPPSPAPPRLVTPSSASDTILAKDPFHPLKVLNHFDKLKAVAQGENTSPITVEIDPSNRCNHACKWCVSALSHTGEYIELECFERLVSEFKHMGVQSVVLKGGGEPTIHPQFPDLIQSLQNNSLSIGLITNGTLLRPGSLEAIQDHVDWARISLDAANPKTHHAIHGTKDFQRIIDNVTWLAKHASRTLVGLNFVAEPRNISEIEAFARMGRDLGAAYISLRYVFDPASSLSTVDRLALSDQVRLAKALETDSFRVMIGNLDEACLDTDTPPFPSGERCLGPNLVGVVGAEGEVYACCFLRGNKSFSFGNVNEQSFSGIWNSKRRREVMERVYRGECGRVCLGGMTYNRYLMYNQILNYLAREDNAHTQFA